MQRLDEIYGPRTDSGADHSPLTGEHATKRSLFGFFVERAQRHLSE